MINVSDSKLVCVKEFADSSAIKRGSNEEIRPSGSNGPGNNAKAESLIQYALWATLLHVSCVSESLKSPRGKGFITINTRFDISQISSILYG